MNRPDDQWIQTYTGRRFWPLDPLPEDIVLEDIAHALSMKCRFTGHTQWFYSVAQHSVFVSMIVPQEHRAYALLHDAAEAYLPDVARPVKRQLAGFAEIEERLMQCICERFRLPWPVPENADLAVKNADLVLLETERRDVMGPNADGWSWRSTEHVKPLEERIIKWSDQAARVIFLSECARLAIE